MSTFSYPLALGKHILVDYSACNYHCIADANVVRLALLEAAKVANATIICDHFRHFSPHGVSGFVVISESHFSVHTWPEYDFAAVDIFTCGDSIKVDLAVDYLKQAFQSTSYRIVANLNRGNIPDEISTPERLSHLHDTSWETIYQRTNAWGVRINVELLGCSYTNIDAIKQNLEELLSDLNLNILKWNNSLPLNTDKLFIEMFSISCDKAQIELIYNQQKQTLQLNVLFAEFIDPRIIASKAHLRFNAQGHKLNVLFCH